MPVLFGLLPGVVTETECQARGGRFCLYSMAWEARQWSAVVDGRSGQTTAWAADGVVEARAAMEVDPDARLALLEAQLSHMSQRLQQVFSTAAELLAGDDLNDLLTRITQRAAHAVHAAPRYLLVVRTGPDQPVHLHHHGFDPAEAQTLADELWRPIPDDAGGSHLIVDIASSRRFYGRLAAIFPPGMRFIERGAGDLLSTRTMPPPPSIS